jgi:hypothetical protein
VLPLLLSTNITKIIFKEENTMKQTKKIAALVMAAAMALSSSAMVFADDATAAPATGEAVGSGSLEGYVDKDVFTVTVPAKVDIGFVIDPQELIFAEGSSTAKLDGSALAAGYGDKVLFKSGSDYTTTSPYYTVINKSTFDVNVSATAKVTGLTGTGYAVSVVDAVTTTNAATEISLKLTPNKVTQTGTTVTTGAALTGTALTAATTGVKATATIASSSSVSDAYKVDKSSGDYKYVYDATKAASVEFNGVTFSLTGQVNQKGDWSNYNKYKKTDPMEVEIVYSVDKANSAETYSKTTGAVISVSTSRMGVGSIAFGDSKDALTGTLKQNFTYSGDGTTLVVTINKSAWPAATVGTTRYIQFTYGDGTKSDVLAVNIVD